MRALWTSGGGVLKLLNSANKGLGSKVIVSFGLWGGVTALEYCKSKSLSFWDTLYITFL